MIFSRLFLKRVSLELLFWSLLYVCARILGTREWIFAVIPNYWVCL